MFQMTEWRATNWFVLEEGKVKGELLYYYINNNLIIVEAYLMRGNGLWTI